MNERARKALPKVALALVPFLLLLGAWVWRQSGEASGTPSVARPSVSASSRPTTISTNITSTPSPTLNQADAAGAQQAAEKVLKVYLSNPSPRVTSDLESLRPLVTSSLYARIQGEWKGATTRAEPRVSEIRSVTLVPLTSDMGVRYGAEVLQIVTFPSGEDEFNTLSPSIRVKQVHGKWIVHDLTVL
jgi:hypothetical protein